VSARVLISEQLAPSAVATLEAAGLVADTQVGLERAQLLEAVVGASALVVRSATQVDAELLAAAPSLVVVGRAGIGLDNIDVKEATRRGVMVVNAPQSNVVSAAEHTMALMLAQARNIPQAHTDLKGGKWNRAKWEGVELRGKVLGIVGLGRVGVLVAQRSLAFGMTLIAYDPFIGADRARQLGVRLVETIDELVAEADFVTVHLPKTPETIGLLGRSALEKAKPELRVINTARGGIVDEAVLAELVAAGRIAGAALDVFDKEPTTESPLFDQPTIVVTPHLGASTVEAQDLAGQTIAEQVVLALRGDFVPFAVNVDAAEASATIRPYLPLAERVGELFTALAGGAPAELEVSFEGGLADYDCRVLTLAVLKGLLRSAVDEPVSFVNAPQLAAERGLTVRETSSSTARDWVNLVSLRGKVGDKAHHVAGTLAGTRSEPRIVGIDEHLVDVPPAKHMFVVTNDDRPGMIGVVGTALGDAGVNIADMKIGRTPGGGGALMVVATDQPVPAEVAAALGARPGILSAKVIQLS
jgi:D-3-phosphoglycerate dehydrogenase / 2-oxoglutarate reductase